MKESDAPVTSASPTSSSSTQRATPHLQATWVRLVVLAALYTLLNAFKPLLIDDTAYVLFARQIAQHPTDPYGFGFVWYFHVEIANHILAPPVFLYWLALGMRLFGDNPVLWKLWLFPICLLFVTAVQQLMRRVAHDLAWPLTIFLVFSPVFLPSLNLMLDVPAVALGLTALNVFLSAVERQSWWRALAAGVIVGLAMQTKYTAVTIPVVMGLWALVRVRPWPEWVQLIGVGLIAAGVFLGWEWYTYQCYGESHFWGNYQRGKPVDWWQQKQEIAGAILSLVGSVSPALILLSLVGLGAKRLTLWVIGALLVVGYLFIGGWQIYFTAEMTHSEVLFGPTPFATWWPFRLSEIIFGGYGILLWLLMMGTIWVLARGPAVLSTPLPPTPGTIPPASTRWVRHRIEAFLILWMTLEIFGYFFLTPFPAVRRIMGVFLVFTLIVARVASLTCHSPERRRLVWGVVAYGVGFGLFFQASDWLQARLQAEAAGQARAWIDDHRHEPLPDAEGKPAVAWAHSENATIWYSGHWGFKYYAESHGMKEVIVPYDKPDVPFPLPQRTILKKGDWLVIPDWRIFQAGVERTHEPLVEVGHLALSDGWPWRTLFAYYGGSVGIDHSECHSRIEVKIYRVTADFAAYRGNPGFAPE